MHLDVDVYEHKGSASITEGLAYLIKVQRDEYVQNVCQKSNYSRTSIARTPLGPRKSVRAMGSSSQ